MALQNVNIDDRNFDQLLNLLKQHIPAADWTDHHPSDPGIMLLELFSWLGDMTLYRMNTVPDAHREKFLKLLIDPPEHVSCGILLSYQLLPGRTNDLIIPAGTRFATDFKNEVRFVFETVKDTVILAPAKNLISSGKRVVQTRSWKWIESETAGISNGLPNQVIPLKNQPVLLDFIYRTQQYDPNPAVYVDGQQWQLKQFLMTESSQGVAQHVMLDPFENALRFGDGVYGAVPEEGAIITCDYQVLQGPEAQVAAGEVKHIFDNLPGLQPGESLTVTGNHDAEGGMYFVHQQDRLAKGLEHFKQTYRLITADDFQEALLTRFNNLQQSTRENVFNGMAGKELAELPASLLKIYRATALMNVKPHATKRLVESPGHVTLQVVPEFTGNESPPYYTPEMLELHPELEEKALRFLEARKLIATHLHLIPARLKEIEIRIKAVIVKEYNAEEMKKNIEQTVYRFLDLLHGGLEGKGWPTGRDLYKSTLFRLLEGIQGVDYVPSLTINAAGGFIGTGSVTLESYELPVVSLLEVTVERS